MDISDSKRRFFSGDTLQQALVQAANHFRLQPEEIAYTAIEKRHGFTKVRRKVVIEVDPANARRIAEPPAVVVAAPRKPPEARAAERGTPVVTRSEASPSQAATFHPEQAESPRQQPAEEGRYSRPASADQAASMDRPANVDRPTSDRAHSDRPAAERRPGGAGGGFDRRRGPAGGRGGMDRGGSGGGDRNRQRRPSGAYPRDRRPGDVGLSETGVASENLVALPERPRSIGERYPAAEGPQADAAEKGVQLLLSIAGLSLTPHIYQGEDRLEIDLVGADTDWCFADDGEFLMAIEHLLPRIIRSLSGEAPLCRVDCDNFHEIREERLRSLAQKIADEVRQRGRSRTLVPMNPADRRIVHVTLADDPAVVTESEGDGYFKRITIRPA